MRALRAADDVAARLALAMFTTSIAKAIAAMAAVLGGLDLIVFTGGIGEHDGAARQDIIDRLSWVGRFDTRILPAREEDIILRHATGLLAP